MKIMLMAGSLRKDSVNKKMIMLTQKMLKVQGVDAEVKEFASYEHPLYDGDIEAKGLPQDIQQFIHDMDQYEGIVFAVPEYNYSIAGPFKNFIDWISRARPMPWAARKILLMSASPAGPGGIRGLWHLRVPLEGCGAFVFPDMFALGNAYNAFDPNGNLIDKGLDERLQGLLKQFVDFTVKLS